VLFNKAKSANVYNNIKSSECRPCKYVDDENMTL